MVAPRTGRVLAGAVLAAALAAAVLGAGAAAQAGPVGLGRTATRSVRATAGTGEARVARTTAARVAAPGTVLAARTTAVGIGAREYRFAVYRPRVRRGVVLLELTNYGQDAHDLVVETRGGRRLGRTGRVRSGARATLTLRLAELTNYGQDAHDLVVETRGGRRLGRTGRVRSGARATLTLRLAPGTYRLVCDLANHAALGMRTTIRVTP